MDVGDEVRKRTAYRALEDDEYQRQVDQAEADLEAARANLEDAEGALETASREFDRAKSPMQERSLLLRNWIRLLLSIERLKLL